MTKRRILLNVLIMAAMATAAFAADVTGKWAAEVQGRDGQKMTQMFDLKASGETLTGTVSSPRGASPPG